MARIAIVGGGISGLSLAYFLLEKRPSTDIVILESEAKPGGKILTERTEGFLCEGGVNGFLDNRPMTLEFARKIGLEPVRSNDAARKRYIFSDGQLHRLPESPPAFLTSGLLSLAGRLRVMAELIIPRTVLDEETLASFAQRRLGREAYEKLIDPMASGIYAGNPEVMSLRACFPKVYDLELKYGGLIKGMIRLQRERKKRGSADKVGPGPGGILTSFYHGMGEMTDALKTYLGERLKVGHKVVAIDRSSDEYSVFVSDGPAVRADIVVLAAPAYAVSGMLAAMDDELSRVISEIPYPSVAVVCFGYRKEKLPSGLDGFGFLIPSREKRKVLGTLWDSSIFPNRVPEGSVLLRSMVGGARAPELAMDSDERIYDFVRKELDDIMKIRTEPDFMKMFRWEKAIPQYVVGHQERLNTIDALLAGHRNLYVTGNSYRGIGVNDCIENSYRLSRRILE